MPWDILRLMSRLAWLVFASGAVVGAYLLLVFIVQRSLLFPAPVRFLPDAVPGAEVVRLKAAGGEALALLLTPAGSSRAPLVMFMHGNGELADDWVPEFDVVRQWGMAALLVEYPGYGRAPGAPTERSIIDAVHAAFDWAAADPRIDASRIVAYGRSLGGGAAARLAVDRKVAALVLESSFTSVADFAAKLLAPAFLVRDPFDNRSALANYRGPLLVIHGTHDTIVPIEHGRALAKLVADARFLEIDCGHNDCPRPWDAIRAFLRQSRVLH